MMNETNSTSMSDSDRMLIDAREAAKRLCISPRTLWALTKCGEIPHIRCGRRVLYDPLDLAAFIDRKRVGGPAARG